MRSRARRSRGIRCCSRACSPTGARPGRRTPPRPISGRSRASSSPKSSSSWPASARSIRLDGVRGRRSGALFDSDLTVRHRIPTVTAERALIDVSSRAHGGSARPCARRRDPAPSSSTSRSSGGVRRRLLPAPGRSMSKVHAVLGRADPRLRPGRQRPRDPSAARTHRGRAPAAQAAAPHDAARARGSESTSRIPS